MNQVINQDSSKQVSGDILESVILHGDLSKLSAGQRVDYMTGVCRTLGLNPATKPFEFLTLQGKMIMYARRDCTDQLRKIHGVSITIKAREIINGVYVVTANAADQTGRCDESTGAVPTEGLKGEAMANALMKAETKAKRRVTLSICGLGMLDESEVESIAQDSRPPKVATVTGEVLTKKPTWTDEQSKELGGITASLKDISEEALTAGRILWKKMAYDAPTDVLDAMSLLLKEWQDHADSQPVVVTDDK